MAATSQDMNLMLSSIGHEANLMKPFLEGADDGIGQISKAAESCTVLKIATLGLSSLPQAFASFQQIPGLFGQGLSNVGIFASFSKAKIGLMASKSR